MRIEGTRRSVLFADSWGRPVMALFGQEHVTSDGGVVLMQACDRQLGLTEALIGSIADRRQPGKVRNAIGDPVRQRLYGIACSYPDANDASRFGSDPIQKLQYGRDSVRGEELASLPTLSRFEKTVDGAEHCRMGIALAAAVIGQHRRRLKRKVKRITIDLDPRDNPTHGAQQPTSFNGHYDTWCYLPEAGFWPSTKSPSNIRLPGCCAPAMSVLRSARSESSRACCRSCARPAYERGCG